MHAGDGPALLLVEQIDDHSAHVVTAVSAVLEAAGVPLLVHVSGPRTDAPPPTLVRLLERDDLLGLIVAGRLNPHCEHALRRALDGRPLPFVQLNQLSALGGPVTGGVVHADATEGARQLVRHLVVEESARRVLVVRGHRHHADGDEREAAVRHEFAALGMPLPEEFLVDTDGGRESAYHAVREALTACHPVDAVLALADRTAFGTLDAACSLGLAVPDQLLVTGFDDLDLAALCRPALTTVRVELAEQGAAAATMLLALAAGGAPGEAVVPVSLMRRRSSHRSASLHTPGPSPSDPVERAERSDTAVADQLWSIVEIRDLSLDVSRALLGCRSIEAVLEEMSAHLDRLGIRRAFLVLRTEELGEARGFVALAHLDGQAADLRDEQPYDLREILPPRFAAHLAGPVLALHPLSVGDVEVGYLLLEQEPRLAAQTGDALTLDLSRAIDAIRSTSRLTRHADELEALVHERTQQLEAEIVARRDAEEELRRLNAELRASLHLDGLTGIANRAAFDDAIAAQWAGHTRSQQPLSLVMVDVDHFKAFNDRYGHLAGDDALRSVADCLAQAVRRLGDVAARFGGEEFALILPNTSDDGALVVAERIRDVLARKNIPHADSLVDGRLTVSIGVATAYPDMVGHPDELIAAADLALYDVKDSGRDGIAVSRGLRRDRALSDD